MSLEKREESGHEMPPHLGEDLEFKPEDSKKLLGCFRQGNGVICQH